MKKDFISITDLTKDEMLGIFKLASELKKNPLSKNTALSGKSVGLIFEKPSNRTRLSFEVGVYELGGNPIYMAGGDIQIGVREEVKDIARVLSRYLDAIVARTYRHTHIVELAKYSDIPVINALSDLLHPCQALADIFTIYERLGRLEGVKVGYVGDGNNVLHSLMLGSAMLGVNISAASPKDYEPDAKITKEAGLIASKSGSSLEVTNDPLKAVTGCDAVYTDVWVSMGQEKEAKKRKSAFKGFQLNEKLLSRAKKNALVMHCLPAHRGEEITDEVIEDRNSVVFDQAENKLHVVKALLLELLKEKA